MADAARLGDGSRWGTGAALGVQRMTARRGRHMIVVPRAAVRAPLMLFCKRRPRDMNDASMNPDLATLLRDCLADPRYAYSIGGYGALAEFHDDTARAGTDDDTTLSLVSSRGALCIELAGVTLARAWECLSARAERWQCGIGLLAPRSRAARAARRVLTELGPDREAVEARHRSELLFDLGVGLPHADFCIRTGDAALIGLLRASLGERVLETGHALLEAIIEAAPHRVVRSSAARIEVYQRIDRRRTPDGPHTHLLPGLLGRRRAHDAALPYPDDCLPVLTLHPENPLVDATGRERPFARDAWQRFEAVLARYGDPHYLAEKQRQVDAVAQHRAPTDYARPRTRLGRLARRVALRQLVHVLPDPAPCRPWLEQVRA